MKKVAVAEVCGPVTVELEDKRFETATLFNRLVSTYVTDRDFPGEAGEVMEIEHIGTDHTMREEECRTPFPKELSQTAIELTPPNVEESPRQNVAHTSTPGTSTIPSNLFISPKEYKGFPKAGARKSKKARTKGRS
ncbi:hypothetical protein RN001_003574 [Aquatica leii]|uniref:Uncharacterized protein n=1 Tax=Aquatica leii TaxID=1421715 RepID=A0AAN7PIR7_9COLE|nr:hypothetical protein RN001_003574 [Aquatica leii]